MRCATPLALCSLLLLAAGPAVADVAGTLSLEIDIQGEQTWHIGRDHGSAHVSEHYRLSIPLRAEDDLMDVNPLAPFAASDGRARYRFFLGAPECRAEIDVRIDNRAEGAYADVQGLVPFVATKQAHYQGTDVERALLCQSQQLVHDVHAGSVDLLAIALQPARGTYAHRERDRVRAHETQAAMGGFPSLLDWVTQQLRDAPATGTRQAVLPVPDFALLGPATAGAQFEGGMQVSLRWSFQPG